MAIDHSPLKLESVQAQPEEASSINYLAISGGDPFKTSFKSGEAPIMVARNCATPTRDCSTPDVPPSPTQRTDVDINQRTNVDQRTTVGQTQNTDVDVNTGDQKTNVDVHTGDQKTDVRTGDQSALSQSSAAGGQGGSVRFNEQNNTNIDARALGLARSPILVNQCTDLAVQLGGGSGFVHADVGFMSANKKCMDAILTNAQCNGVRSLAEANVITAQSSLMFKGNEQFGMTVQRQIAQTTLDLAQQCAGVEIKAVAPPPPQPSTGVSREEFSRYKTEQDEKLNRAFEHSFRK